MLTISSTRFYNTARCTVRSELTRASLVRAITFDDSSRAFLPHRSRSNLLSEASYSRAPCKCVRMDGSGVYARSGWGLFWIWVEDSTNEGGIPDAAAFRRNQLSVQVGRNVAKSETGCTELFGGFDWLCPALCGSERSFHFWNHSRKESAADLFSFPLSFW